MSISMTHPTGPGWIGALARRLHARNVAWREADAFVHLDPAILADIGLPRAAASANLMLGETPPAGSA